jgi:LmbE family N-acetylglucosaminyl deacetylase
MGADLGRGEVARAVVGDEVYEHGARIPRERRARRREKCASSAHHAVAEDPICWGWPSGCGTPGLRALRESGRPPERLPDRRPCATVHEVRGSSATLIFAPHVDDEVLGCFAFLAPGTHVLHAGVEDRPSEAVRRAELAESAAALGFTFGDLGRNVNSFRCDELVPDFEQAVEAQRPDTVLIPEPSYNQDHRAVYDAAIVATRPHDTNWRVGRVLVYEQPDSVLWRHGSVEMPSVFAQIDVDAKVLAYRRYASQVRGHRSPEMVVALARLRGAQIGVPAAEAYHCRRLVMAAETS